ncbi:MAG: site-specific DNA-methyltransferase [Verrucomicrobiota bacterium]|nr:site-specific DNA-methyltransferase [Verrucomicrobiota bacterium]
MLRDKPEGATVEEIRCELTRQLGETAGSSVRSYLRLNTPGAFMRLGRGRYAFVESGRVREETQPSFSWVETSKINGLRSKAPDSFQFGRSTLIQGDCFAWLETRAAQSIHAVVTDPPYGLVEYSEREQAKLRAGRGGVWRIPPNFDGHPRSPLPRFTVLSAADLRALDRFFHSWSCAILRVLVPGGHVVVASNPLVSYAVAAAAVRGGLERRGEVIRLTMTMRGGDRPKAAHEEFGEVSVMPRSMWEPWLIFRKPIHGRVQDNLRKWRTGGFRRPSKAQPFGDVIASSPTRAAERKLAPHPSLKPQAFLRKIVRAVLPLGEGIVLDPFAGGGSTLAAAEVVGYESIGIEHDADYFRVACAGIPRLAALQV